ncbi:shikimate kinase [Nocardia cyriacigeorgica]|uniref:Shikimate kinase n=1 Tax=Nocardia cyriacigeorgica TaxID=135487 RepID=A0A5R8NVD4_9NOCA|nr:shikimate kinase [Nocardia cyriacigeorgica]TLF79566.1 shikimate kinase [Nocardia cyriacigeorgica]
MTSQADPRAPRVVLVGPPGAGKSTIGRKLARELGVQLYDTDVGIEQETGRSIADIFATDGEAEFRRIEEQVVRRAILDEPGVVSLGGGAVLSENTRALLREHTVVYLEISVAEGLRRTGTSNARPLLNGADPGAKYRELMRRRRPLYREVATVRVRTDGRSPGRVVKMILGKLSLESVRPAAGEAIEQQNRPRTTNPQGSSRSRARRRSRARAAARKAAQAAANGQTGTTDQTATTATGQSGTAAGPNAAASTSSTGRSRRARARRARARARTQQERTESEQST